MNPRRPAIVLVGFALAASLACAPSPPEPVAEADPSAHEERGRAVAAELQRRLKGELVAALAEGGPEAAIAVCAERAPAIAQDMSTDGIAVGRATHRPRNPANEASGWLEPVVRAYVESDGAGGPTVVPLGDGRVGYAEPILVQPPCLMCHGSAIEATLSERIRAAYPDDRAVDFAQGDFRGVVWVTLPADGTPGEADEG